MVIFLLLQVEYNSTNNRTKHKRPLSKNDRGFCWYDFSCSLNWWSPERWRSKDQSVAVGSRVLWVALGMWSSDINRAVGVSDVSSLFLPFAWLSEEQKKQHKTNILCLLKVANAKRNPFAAQQTADHAGGIPKSLISSHCTGAWSSCYSLCSPNKPIEIADGIQSVAVPSASGPHKSAISNP